MAEETTIEGPQSIDTVIRGFTDAELALREVSGAVERIRSASEQLDLSRADQSAAREALQATSDAVETLGRRVEELAAKVADTQATLASLEPERLWHRLDEQAAAHQRTESALQKAREELETHDARARRAMNLAWVGLAVGVATLALLAAAAIGLVRLG